MKYIQIMCFMNLLTLAYNCNGQEIPATESVIIKDATSSISEQENNKNVEKNSSTTVQQEQEEKKTEEKSESSAWEKHLQELLVKGAFWNAADNVPTADWENKAIELATEIVKNNTNSADEVKSSFFTTMNEKYSKVENGTDFSGIIDKINNFNTAIDALITKSPQKEEKDETVQNITNEEIETDKMPIQEPIISEASAGTMEEVAKEQLLSEEEKKEKKQKKQLLQWEECLKNIKIEGTDEKETDGMIEETITVATQIVSSMLGAEQTDTAQELQKQFADALEERDKNKEGKNIYSIDTTKTITRFNNALNTVLVRSEQNSEPIITAYPPAQEMNTKKVTNKKQPSMRTNQTVQESSSQLPIVLDAQEKKADTISTLFVQSTPTQVEQSLLNIRLEMAEKAKEERMKNETIQKNQKLVAEKIQQAAKQKAETQSAQEEKGIISSVIAALFNPWSRSSGEKSVKNIYREYDEFIEHMVKNKFDANTKEQIKTAYRIFQDTLLAFDTKPYWNNEKNIPNEKWIKKIKGSLTILLKYDIVTTDTVINALKTTFKTNKNMTVEDYEKIIAIIENYINEQITAINMEKADVARKKREDEIQAQKEMRMNQEREKEKKQIQQSKKEAEQKMLAELPQEWNNALKRIAEKKNPTKEENEKATTEALGITYEILKAAPLKNKNTINAIVAKHIEQFTKAFLAQYRKNGEESNVDRFITSFNQEIHKLSLTILIPSNM